MAGASVATSYRETGWEMAAPPARRPGRGLLSRAEPRIPPKWPDALVVLLAGADCGWVPRL